jgi:hypothetical protein
LSNSKRLISFLVSRGQAGMRRFSGSFDATFRDGGYNTEPGIMDMLGRMKSGRLKVSDHCRE